MKAWTGQTGRKKVGDEPLFQICGRECSNDAGHGERDTQIDRREQSVGVSAANERGGEAILRLQVIEVTAVPEDQCPILDAADGASEQAQLIRHSGVPFEHYMHPTRYRPDVASDIGESSAIDRQSQVA